MRSPCNSKKGLETDTSHPWKFLTLQQYNIQANKKKNAFTNFKNLS